MIAEYSLLPSTLTCWPSLPFLGQQDDLSRRQARLEALQKQPYRVYRGEDATLKARRLEMARISGDNWGSAYGGNPWALARNQKARVELVSPARLLEIRGYAPGPGRQIMGLIRPGRRSGQCNIYIDATLTSAQIDETLAHELSHALHSGSEWTEEMHDEFAKSFMACR